MSHGIEAVGRWLALVVSGLRVLMSEPTPRS
jgi:hypothetical protein